MRTRLWKTPISKCKKRKGVHKTEYDHYVATVLTIINFGGSAPAGARVLDDARFFANSGILERYLAHHVPALSLTESKAYEFLHSGRARTRA